MTTSHRVRFRLRATLTLFLLTAPTILRAQAPIHVPPVSIPEVIEWTWEVRPEHPVPSLPNVLLLGDSITRGYFPQVTKRLDGIANVYLMAVSTSVGDPRLPNQVAEFAALEHVAFRVVHFNNGMHGWEYTEAQFASAFPAFVSAVTSIPGHPALIWASITPVRGEASGAQARATNPRIDARNAAAAVIVKQQHIPIDDLHALMLPHDDLHGDAVHYNATGSSMMADQAAAAIKQPLAAQ